MTAVMPLSDAKRKLLEKYLLAQAAENVAFAWSRPITKRATDRPAPLSLSQEHIWHHVRNQDLPPLYNESVTIHHTGPLDTFRLEQVLTDIVRRHEIWRTTFELVDGLPCQIVHPAPRVHLPVLDLRGIPQSERESQMAKVLGEDLRKPFNLADLPLVRFTLVRCAPGVDRLFVMAHQIVIDGVSLYQVFLSELVQGYTATSNGKPTTVSDLSIQYSDFASWQREWLQGDELAAQIAYWRNQFSRGVPVLAWPGAPRPSLQTFRGAFYPFALSKALTESLKQLSALGRVTLFSVLVACLAALLQRYTGQEDITVGTMSPSGRKRSEVQRLLGYFLNPVPLRLTMNSGCTVDKLVHHCAEAVSGALTHDDIPFHLLEKEIAPPADPSRNPFFTVATSLEPPLAPVGPEWSLTPMDIESGGAKWDLYVVFDDRPGGIIGRVQYNPDIFDRAAISTMLHDFECVARNMIGNTQARVRDLSAEC